MSILERDLEEALYSHPQFVPFVAGRAVTGWLRSIGQEWEE